MSYDPACEQLADHFLDEALPGRDATLCLLAQHIQDQIEEWIRGLELDIARDEEPA